VERERAFLFSFGSFEISSWSNGADLKK
jgi:hypothetical protein